MKNFEKRKTLLYRENETEADAGPFAGEQMMNTGILTKDLGTILVGKEAVEEGLINEVGGISDAFAKLHQLIEKK